MRLNLIFWAVLILYTIQLSSQNSQVLATLNVRSDVETLGTVNKSLIFRDNQSIYISDGTLTGTKILRELDADEEVLHQRTELNGKFYFTIGSESSRFSILEVDPETQSMTSILTDQTKITGLVDYNGYLYFGLSDHPIYGNAYMRMNIATLELQEIFPLTSNGVEDAIVHDGLIFLILKSNNNLGTYLAKSNGNQNNLQEYYNLGDSENRNIEPRRINMTSAGEKLFFWHSLDFNNYTLYVTEGEATNTHDLKSNFKRNSKQEYSIFKYRDIGVLGERTFFSAQDINGNATVARLWTSDGTIEGTKELLFEGEGIQAPGHFTILGSQIFFHGTKENTETAFSISENSEFVEEAIDFTSPMSEIRNGGRYIINHKERLYFEAFGIDNRIDLYAKDLTSKSIERLTRIEEDFGYILWSFETAGDNLFFYLTNFDTNSQLRIFNPETTSTERNQDKPISIYPNPSSSHIKVKGFQNFSDYTIYDIYGRVLVKFSNSNTSLIDISSLKSGLYYLEVIDDNYRTTTSFVKI